MTDLVEDEFTYRMQIKDRDNWFNRWKEMMIEKNHFLDWDEARLKYNENYERVFNVNCDTK
jgi:hypothetical protein